MHGLKRCHFCLKQRRFTLVLRAAGFVCMLVNLFTSQTEVNKYGTTHSDEIHQLVPWNPLEVFDLIALSVFLLLI